MRRFFLPVMVLLLGLGFWQMWVGLRQDDLVPSPFSVGAALVELAQREVLLEHVVASLYRVSWGFSAAVLVGIPLGLAMGWYVRLHDALNPILQLLRPISPIAWIPLAILWFGVSDAAPIFIIFLASLFPILVSATAAVRNIPPLYIQAARNFGLSGPTLLIRVILPASLPQLVTGLRVALGVAWLVVVAAEMIAVRSGLGWLILDARNAGKRYDLVVAAMVLIGGIGLVLDWGLRCLEHLPEVRWGVRR